MSLARLIATDLKHNPPTLDERLQAMGASRRELDDSEYFFSLANYTGQASPNERT